MAAHEVWDFEEAFESHICHRINTSILKTIRDYLSDHRVVHIPPDVTLDSKGRDITLRLK